MAKALLGYMTSNDPRVVAQLTAETRRLRQQVADLEAHVLRLQSENDSLALAAHDRSRHRACRSTRVRWRYRSVPARWPACGTPFRIAGCACAFPDRRGW